MIAHARCVALCLSVGLSSAACYSLEAEGSFPCADDNECPGAPERFVCVAGTCHPSCFETKTCPDDQTCTSYYAGAFCSPACSEGGCPDGLTCDESAKKHVCAVTLPACTALPKGAVSWWSGDGPRGDQLGRNDTDTWSAQQPLLSVPGVVGQAYTFRKDAGDSVEATTLGFPTANADRTIEGWVRLRDGSYYASRRGGWGEDSGGLLFGYGQRLRGDTRGFAVASMAMINTRLSNLAEHFPTFNSEGEGPCIGCTDARLLHEEVWYHLGVTVRGGVATLYVNGSARSSSAITLQTRTMGNTMFIGGNHEAHVSGSPSYGDPSNFIGDVDEVTIYSRALDAAEIAAIFNAGSAGKCR